MASRSLSPLFTWRSAIVESDLPPTTKLVALALSLHMNERGGSCYPSIQTLARESSLGVSTVREQVGRLEDEGWLEREIGGGRRSNRYTASVPDPATSWRGAPPLLAGSPPAPGEESVIEGVMEDDSSTATTASEVLAAFNEEAETDFRSARYLSIIEEQIVKRPDLDLVEHRRAIRCTLDLSGKEKWWKGSPSPDLIYANERAFERALNLPDQQRLSYTTA